MTNKDDCAYLDLLDTLKFCSSKILDLPNIQIEYLILEDLALDYNIYFHESTLDYLLSINCINDDIYYQIVDLREKIHNIILLDEKRNIHAFRNDPLWLEIYAQSDSIFQILHDKNGAV